MLRADQKTLNIKDMISEFVEFRHEVGVRCTQYELREANKKKRIYFRVILSHWITWMK